MDKNISQKHAWNWEIKPESFWFEWQLPQIWSSDGMGLPEFREDFLFHQDPSYQVIISAPAFKK